MKILGFDTSTEACSVGLYLNGEMTSRFELTPRRHTECVLPWCDALLEQAQCTKKDLDAIAVGIGPGAFTGVRLAVSLAQGMALGLSIPVVAVSTLACMAQTCQHDGPIMVLIDARMDECYVGYYQKIEGIVQKIADEQLLAPENIQLPTSGNWIGVGSGFTSYANRIAKSVLSQMRCVDAKALPQPEAFLQLAVAEFNAGNACAPEFVEPTYLRDKVALTIKERENK